MSQIRRETLKISPTIPPQCHLRGFEPAIMTLIPFVRTCLLLCQKNNLLTFDTNSRDKQIHERRLVHLYCFNLSVNFYVCCIFIRTIIYIIILVIVLHFIPKSIPCLVKGRLTHLLGSKSVVYLV